MAEKHNKIVSFVEHPAFWGGVGVIAGAAAVTVNMGILFAFGWISLVIAVLRTRLFEGRGRLFVITGNTSASLVLAGLLLGVWHFTPKPKEPPTAEENATAFVALESKMKRESAANTPSQPTSLPPLKSPHNHKSPERPAQPPQNVAPPAIAQFSIIQNDEVSTKADMPYKIQVVVQANIEFSSLRLAVQCDGPIAQGALGNTGMFMGGQGVMNGHANIFVLNYQSALPPFGPTNPIIIDLWSVNHLTCDQVSSF